MQYFSVQYDAGFYNVGVAYLAARNRQWAKQQVKLSVKRQRAIFNLRTLKQVSKAEYLRIKDQAS